MIIKDDNQMMIIIIMMINDDNYDDNYDFTMRRPRVGLGPCNFPSVRMFKMVLIYREFTKRDKFFSKRAFRKAMNHRLK